MSSVESPRRSGNKRGENKGIAKARKDRKRAEAVERNARTPEERTRVYREGPVDKRAQARKLRELTQSSQEVEGGYK